MKKTPWFSAHVKPVRDGVYERNGAYTVSYSKFSRGEWYMSNWSPEDASQARTPSVLQNSMPWRGLAQCPKGRRA